MLLTDCVQGSELSLSCAASEWGNQAIDQERFQNYSLDWEAAFGRLAGERLELLQRYSFTQPARQLNSDSKTNQTVEQPTT